MFKMFLLKSIRLTGIGILATALIACASTTTIRVTDESGTIDRDVRIYVDGSYGGRGEVDHSDIKIVGSTTYVTLKKEGCRSFSRSFSRSEELHVGALIIGLCFTLIPLLWVMGYKPIHSYEFTCDET